MSWQDVGEDRRTEAVREARGLLEAEGAITMRRLAEQMGIRAPSLYKHFPDKAALETALIADVFEEMTEVLEPAGDDLTELLGTYRSWALRHPRLYLLATQTVLRRDLLPPGLEQRAAMPVVAAAGDDPHRARALWASAHGLVSLELAHRFPPDADLDRAWAALAEAFTATP